MSALRPSAARDHAAAQTLARRLDDGLAALGRAASAEQRQQLLDYLALLHRWNAVYNLTSVRDVLDMLSVHLLDSLAIVPLVERYAAGDVLDVGSGAGLPSIPLAIMNPVRVIHSVDAVAKKIGFQLQVKGALDLDNFFPTHARVEALTLAGAPGLIVSRAYADLSAMLCSIDSLADPQTVVLAMKGATPNEEIAAIPTGWQVRETIELDVPFLGAQRCAVILQRAG